MMRKMWEKVIGSYLMFKADDEGQTLVEYALLLALIAIVCIAILVVLGREVSSTFSEITSGLQGS